MVEVDFSSSIIEKLLVINLVFVERCVVVRVPFFNDVKLHKKNTSSYPYNHGIFILKRNLSNR